MRRGGMRMGRYAAAAMLLRRYGSRRPMLPFIPAGPANPTVGYVLALGAIFGFAGLHRMYLGRPLTGVVWLFTWGLCGLGTVYDLVTMGQLVDDYNGYIDPEDQAADDAAAQAAQAAAEATAAANAAAAAAAAAASQAGAAGNNVVVKETIREVVKLKCAACGVLMDQTADKCPTCGAPI